MTSNITFNLSSAHYMLTKRRWTLRTYTFRSISEPSVSSSRKKTKQRVNSFWESRLKANWNNFLLLQGRPNYIFFELQDWEKEILWVNIEQLLRDCERKGNREKDNCKANGHFSVITVLYITLSSYMTPCPPLPFGYLKNNSNIK